MNSIQLQHHTSTEKHSNLPVRMAVRRQSGSIIDFSHFSQVYFVELILLDENYEKTRLVHCLLPKNDLWINEIKYSIY